MKQNKVKTTPKKITNEVLARMIAKGFEETAKKADVDERFRGVDKRLDGVDKRLDGVDCRLDSIKRCLDAVASDVGLIRADIHDLKTTQEADIKNLYPRVERLEKKMLVRQ